MALAANLQLDCSHRRVPSKLLLFSIHVDQSFWQIKNKIMVGIMSMILKIRNKVYMLSIFSPGLSVGLLCLQFLSAFNT